MNDATNQVSEFFESSEGSNMLWQYVQSMNPETAARLSKPESAEVLQVMERNIMGMLGGLPLEHFDVTITTSRQQLGRLLASAMMSGYFLRNVEQRMNFEESILGGGQE
ncbi:MAG: DUF760 domain-containing protein [Oculatellaceae cyanobacterium Prado106]|jgi:hypothetical protein|nr:DUF760 domain-containing protein [Oculatellaceae cyanobacterium Prado106]